MVIINNLLKNRERKGDMVDESNLQEVELLTKRFRDYIDKVQNMLEKAEDALPANDDELEKESTGKFYTVISPVDAMAVNLHSVLNTLERAIKNIEEISGLSSAYQVEKADGKSDKNSDLVVTDKRLFSVEELQYLEKTFNKILNASAKERNQILEGLDKTTNS